MGRFLILTGLLIVVLGAVIHFRIHVPWLTGWIGKLPAPMSDEGDMLGDLISRRENSRLSCQIVVNDALDGLKVQIAPEE